MRTFHFGVGKAKFKVELAKDSDGEPKPGEVFLRCSDQTQLEALQNRLNLPGDVIQGRANACLAMSASAALTMICRVWEDNLQAPPASDDPYTNSDRLGMGHPTTL
jgi:hypothetical protein